MLTPVLRYAQHHEPGTSSFVIQDVPLGSASANRAVVVVVIPLGVELQDVKVGGITASPIVSGSIIASGFIFIAIVPTGIDADIEITFTEDPFNNTYVAVYTCDGVDAEAPVADYAEAQTEPGEGGTVAIELDIPAGGAAIAFGLTAFSLSDSNIIEWTGASEDYEYQDDYGGFFVGYSVASFATETAALGHTISIERQDEFTDVFGAIAGVALRPMAAAAGFSNIYLGETQINAIKLGSDDVKAVYLGSTKIFEKA